MKPQHSFPKKLLLLGLILGLGLFVLPKAFLLYRAGAKPSAGNSSQFATVVKGRLARLPPKFDRLRFELYDLAGNRTGTNAYLGDGKFEIRGAEPGTYSLRVTYSAGNGAYGGDTQASLLLERDIRVKHASSKVNLRRVYLPEGTDVIGEIIDLPSGTDPVWLRLRGSKFSDGSEPFSIRGYRYSDNVKLDNRGNFEFLDVPLGDYQIHAFKGNESLGRVRQLKLTEDVRKLDLGELPLPDFSRATGRITNLPELHDDLQIEFRPVDRSSGYFATLWLSTVGSGGSFSIDRLGAGQYRILLRFENHQLAPLSENVQIDSSRSITNLGEIRLPDLVHAFGTISISPLPVGEENRTINLLHDGEFTISNRTNLDPQGNFDLGNILAGKYKLEYYEGFYPAKVVLIEEFEIHSGNGEMQLGPFELKPKASMIGRIVDIPASTHITALEISTEDRGSSFLAETSEIESDGTFEFHDIPAGEYTMALRTSEAAYALSKRYIVTNVSEMIDIGEVRVPETGTVTGQIVNMPDRNLEFIRIERKDRGYRSSRTIDPMSKDGNFEFSHVAVGEYELWGKLPIGMRNLNRDISVRAGSNELGAVRIGEWGSLKLSLKGVPVDKFQLITFSVMEGETLDKLFDQSKLIASDWFGNSDGSMTLEHVPVGEVHLRMDSNVYEFDPVSVRIRSGKTTDIKIAPRPTTYLQLVPINRQGRLKSVEMTSSFASKIVPEWLDDPYTTNGRIFSTNSYAFASELFAQIKGPPAGLWRVNVTFVNGSKWSGDVTLVDGEVTYVEIPFR